VKRQIGAVTALSVVGVLALSGTAAAMNVRMLNASPTVSSFGTAEAFVSLDEQPTMTPSPTESDESSAPATPQPSASSVTPSPSDEATDSAPAMGFTPRP